MHQITITTKNADETQKVGETMSQNIYGGNGAIILGLKGELGGGKTTFVQGLAKGLGVEEQITSPTFVIMKKYKGIDRFLFHIDCYRINDSKDMIELGFEEILKSKENVVAIEWAERIVDILPPETLWLEFEHQEGDIRKISFTK